MRLFGYMLYCVLGGEPQRIQTASRHAMCFAACYYSYSATAKTDAASENNTAANGALLDIDLAPDWMLGVRDCVAFTFIISAAFSAIAYVGPIKWAHRPIGITER